MKNKIFRYPAIFLVILGITVPVYPWGSQAHHRITRDAIEHLPANIAPFFQAHIEAIVAHSTDPDVRRRTHPEEAPRHYIDIDHYGKYPFSALPHQWDQAVAKFSADTLKEYGTLPWWIARSEDSLSTAMKAGDTDAIIHWAAFLSHYVADAHQPLHTVMNYDGQLTGNNGVHSRYETGMVDAYLKDYHFSPLKVPAIHHPLDRAFDIVLESNQLVPKIMSADDYAVRKMSPRAVAQLHEHWNTQRDSVYFATMYHLVGAMTWHRLDEASSRLIAYYEAAWKQAGKPVLPETQ